MDRTIEVMHSGMVARKNPLRLYITTASFTKETKFYEDMMLFESMLNGEAEDNPRWFGLLYSLDPGDDWRDEAVWAKESDAWNQREFGSNCTTRGRVCA